MYKQVKLGSLFVQKFQDFFWLFGLLLQFYSKYYIYVFAFVFDVKIYIVVAHKIW